MGRRGRMNRNSSFSKKLPDQPAGMSAAASTIAVSEITGMPAGKLCNWVLVSWAHSDHGSHLLSLISPCMMIGDEPEYDKLISLLDMAASDARRLRAEEAGK